MCVSVRQHPCGVCLTLSSPWRLLDDLRTIRHDLGGRYVDNIICEALLFKVSDALVSLVSLTLFFFCFCICLVSFIFCLSNQLFVLFNFPSSPCVQKNEVEESEMQEQKYNEKAGLVQIQVNVHDETFLHCFYKLDKSTKKISHPGFSIRQKKNKEKRLHSGVV